MVQKPQIQYVGQFYVHGSEAAAIQEKQRKKPKTKLPMARVQQIQRIYIDPVAVAGIAVAVFMLIVMVMGALRIRTDWAHYETMKSHVYELRQENLVLTHRYRDAYDLEDVQNKALGMGMIPKEQAQTRLIRVTIPAKEPERTWLDDLKWFFENLL